LLDNERIGRKVLRHPATTSYVTRTSAYKG